MKPPTEMQSAETDVLRQSNTLHKAEISARLRQLGVEPTKYPAISNRREFAPLAASSDRKLLWSLLSSYRDGLFHRIPDPSIITHILTSRCNYSCEFCSFADSLNLKHSDMKLSEIEKVYSKLGASLNTIIYSGGEPTLNLELPSIIEAAYKLTSVESVFIISNAWRPQLLLEITHRIAQSCPDLHLTWSLSIEGPKELNNSLRFTKGKTFDAWQNTVDTLECLKIIRNKFGYKQLDVQLCTVCSPYNADVLDDWYETVRDELRPDKWNLNLMRRSVQMSDSALPTFEERRAIKNGLQPFESAYIKISQRLRDDVLRGKLNFMYHTRTPQDGALKSAVDLISQDANRRTLLSQPSNFCCKAGTIGGYIGSEGAVSACEEFAHNPHQNKSFGNLRNEEYDFQKIWRGSKAAEYRKQVNKSLECKGCTLESQRNYPAILVSFKSLLEASRLARMVRANAKAVTSVRD